jgi:hypothetical protein
LHFTSFILEDLLAKATSYEEKASILFALLHLKYKEKLKATMKEVESSETVYLPLQAVSSAFEKDALYALNTYFTSPQVFSNPFMKSAFVFLLDSFQNIKPALQKRIIEKLEEMAKWDLPLEEELLVKQTLIEWLTFSKELEKVETYLKQIPPSYQETEFSPFHFFKACLIAKEQGIEAAKKNLHRHEDQLFPPFFYIIDAYLAGKDVEKKRIEQEAFYSEKLELFKQLVLFYKSANLDKEANFYLRKLKKEMLDARSVYIDS